MKSKLIGLFMILSFGLFAQSVPNTTTFNLQDVSDAVYGNHTSGKNLLDAFTASDAAKFDATYGSKTMSPKTMYGFRNYGAVVVTAPVVTTTTVSSITSSTASSGGNVISDGGGTVTARGVCWNTSSNPTLSNSKTTDGTGSGTFTSSITGLSDLTTYYVRAYATNSAGTSYGENESFVTSSVSNSGYGKLYNYYAAVDGRNIAASGWHVPTQAELETLAATVGGQSVAGGKLKETGTTHWQTPNTSADNYYSFNAVGAGIRDPSIEGFIQQWNEIWSTDSGVVMFMQHTSANGIVGINVPLKRGCSIRLIKDDSTLASYTGNDGKTYTTVKIGSQVWLAENLKETQYRNGNSISNVTSKAVWDLLTSGAYCWFNNNSGYE